MKTIALFVVGLAGWLAFLSPTLAEDSDQAAVERSARQAALLWPDVDVPGSPLHNQIMVLWQAAQEMPEYRWITTHPDRAMILARHAAAQLGIPARQAPGTPAPVPPRIVVVPSRTDFWDDLMTRIRTPESTEPSRASEQLLNSRLADIQRQLRKLERR